VVGLVVLRRRRAQARSQGSLAAGAAGSAVAKPPPPAQGLGSGETSAVKRALREACDANDPKAAAKALLRWAEAVWPEAPPRSLGALAIRITPAALEPLKALEERLYARGDKPWDGAALAAALADGLAPVNGNHRAAKHPLPPLYPERG
jgi:hypothetical protein